MPTGSDDIVTRLRMQEKLTVAFPTMKSKDVAPTTWLNEAADEIERLRGEVLKYKALHEACKEHHGD